MRRRAGAVVAVLLAALGLVAATAAGAPATAGRTTGAAAAGAAAPAGDGDARRVVVVSWPRTTWERVAAPLADGRLPNLDRFLRGAALASLSTRTVGAATTPGKAYLTLGAGNRADTAPGVPAGVVADADEPTPAGPAAEVYRERTGRVPTGEVLALDLAPVLARNDDLLFGAEPGALGGALVDAGLATAAVGNADLTAGFGAARDVGLAAIDPTGQVAAGSVGADLLVADPVAPYGRRADPDRVAAAFGAAWPTSAFVVVEASDLERAELAAAGVVVGPDGVPVAGPVPPAVQADAWHGDALLAADALLGAVLGTVDPARDLVVVLAPTPPLAPATGPAAPGALPARTLAQLGLFAVRGPGVDGAVATSATTRRPGYVTLTDVAPTALRALGVEVPDAMGDTPITASGPPPTADGRPVPPAERAVALGEASTRSVARDRAVGPVTVAYIVALVLALAASLVVLSRRARRAPSPDGTPGGARGGGAAALACTAVMAAPPATYLLGLVPGPLPSPPVAIVVVAAAAIGLAVALWPTRRWDPVAPPLAVAALCVAVLAVDVVTGARLQIDTLFGYSPIVAGRFAGFGNQAFALWSINGLIVLTAGWDLWRRRRPLTPQRTLLAAYVVGGLVLVVVDGAPQFGSDVGGVLATVPALAVAGLLLTGRAVRPLRLALIGAATVAVLVAFAALDLARPAASRTHLGRFAGRVLDGGAGLIIERKINANLGVLTSTIWTVVIPVALAFVAYVAWRPGRVLAAVERRHPTFRAFEVGGLVLGVLAWALNDSGVAVPAMMLTVALPWTAYLALDATASGVGPPTADRAVAPTDPDDAEAVAA